MNKLSRTTLIVILLAIVSLPTLAASRQPLRITSLSYHGKCVRADSIITINLNKKITRGFSIIAISGANSLHLHPKIVKWRFRANSIKVLLPPRSILKRGGNYTISIERRLPHKTLSNQKKFRVCRR